MIDFDTFPLPTSPSAEEIDRTAERLFGTRIEHRIPPRAQFGVAPAPSGRSLRERLNVPPRRGTHCDPQTHR